MLLPVVFLCNALLLLTVLNSRFRLLAEAIVSGGVFVLSILLNLLLSPAFNDATGQFGNGMNVLLLLVAAVFLYPEQFGTAEPTPVSFMEPLSHDMLNHSEILGLEKIFRQLITYKKRWTHRNRKKKINL